MLETVREYALVQLRATGEEARLALALEHAKYFTALAKREAGKVWDAEPEVGITRLEQDYDDLVTALEWARTTRAGEDVRVGPAISRGLGPFWERRGFLSEGRDRLAQALRAKRPPEHDKFAWMRWRRRQGLHSCRTSTPKPWPLRKEPQNKTGACVKEAGHAPATWGGRRIE